MNLTKSEVARVSQHIWDEFLRDSSQIKDSGNLPCFTNYFHNWDALIKSHDAWADNPLGDGIGVHTITDVDRENITEYVMGMQMN